jgi:hypothetical protein
MKPDLTYDRRELGEHVTVAPNRKWISDFTYI